MTKSEKILRIMALCLFLVFPICGDIFFPYLAVKAVKKGELKTACAYVIGKEKTKYSYKYLVDIDGKIYEHNEIIQYSATLPKPLGAIWYNFPIKREISDFLTIEPSTCKKVQYIEIYQIFGFKKLFLYDYLQQGT